MKNKFIQITLFVIFLTLIFDANLTLNEIKNATNVFMNTLFPTIFPFFLFSTLLIHYNFCQTLNKLLGKGMNFIFHTANASNFVIIMSLLSGFPSGTKYISELYQKKLLSKDHANYLICFTHFSNPLFVLSTTMTILHSTKLSYFILLSHILANFIIGILIRPKEKEVIKDISINETPPFSKALSDSILSSFQLLIVIFGNTCFFFIITKLLEKYLNLPPMMNLLISGLLDMTKGIQSINLFSINQLLKGILILTFISFGGMNIHMQVANLISNSPIRYKNFLLGRISQLGISMIIFIILYNY